jgi:hypothetical protein
MLTERVGQIENSGYEIQIVMIRKHWGEIKLDEYNLTSESGDTIFVEAVAVVEKRDYSLDNGLTVIKPQDDITSFQMIV